MYRILLLLFALLLPSAYAQTVLADAQIHKVNINLPPWNMEAVDSIEISLPSGITNPSRILSLAAIIHSDLYALSQGSQPTYTQVYRLDRIAGYFDDASGSCDHGCPTLGGNVYVTKNASGAYKIVLNRGAQAPQPPQSFFADYTGDPATFNSTARSRGVLTVEYY